MEAEALHPNLVSHCPDCGVELQSGALAFIECHALVHGTELTKMSAQAELLEKKQRLGEARETWNRMLALLPQDAKQAEWIKAKVKALEGAQEESQTADAQKNAWARKLGPLAPIAIVLAKAKGLVLAIFKLKFLLSFFSFLALYVAMFGWWFGLGFTVCILIHELGHYVDVKRRGLPAEMPVFLPGLGAYVKWTALGVTKRQAAEVSLAGPLAGWMAAVGCLWMYAHTGNMMWAALARTGAVLNLLNLIPVWALDGGKAIESLGKVERAVLLATALVMWSYTGAAIYFLVAAGVVYRFFTKDMPKRDDWRTCFYFAALLVVLGLVMHFSPNVEMP